MTPPVFDEAFWNDLYGDAPIWSGAPNPFLVETASGLAAGSVLDVGSGEGGDAIWLARQGFEVTAVDLSTVALKRAQDLIAHDSATAARITWKHVDLLEWSPPPAAFDLVSSQYMHLPSRFMRDLVTRLAAAVRPGGTLLVVGHEDGAHGPADPGPDASGPAAPGAGRAPASHGITHDHDGDQPTFDPDLFFTAESLVPLLSPAAWEILTAGPRPHPARPGTDAVLHARRR